MSSWNQNQFGGAGGFPANFESEAGSPAIAAFFNSVYGWMAAGLGLTAVVAWQVAANIQSFHSLLHGPLLIGLFIAQVLLVITVAGAVKRINATAATVLFLLYSALNGITLSGIFLVYANATLASTFLVTAATFGAMSVYGMVTQRDLTRLGSLLFMALIGLVIASVVNIFFASSGLYWIINYAGVLIFVGLTAYDTQKLKAVAVGTAGNSAMAARYSIVGALTLYLDFLNLFLFLLQILGNSEGRRR
jgi:uncharacterized protein